MARRKEEHEPSAKVRPRGRPEAKPSGSYLSVDPIEKLRTLQSVPPPGDPAQQERVLGVRYRNLGALSIAVVVADADGLVQDLNPVAERLTGWSRHEARGKALETVFCLVDQGAESQGPLTLSAASFHPAVPRGSSQPLLVSKQGHKHAIQYSLESLADPATGRTQVMVLAQDITEERLNALRLLHLAQHDVLTSLLNRQHFVRHLEHALGDARDGRRAAVVAFLDVDRFRLINDASGLDAGDSLLSWIASMLRESIGRENVAARLGGNEFGLLLYDLDVQQAEELTSTICARLQDFRFAWRESTFSVRTSAGVVAVSGDFDDASAVLGAAEAANERAKEQGGNRVVAWYEPGEAQQMARDQALSWVAHIKDNLIHGRVELYAQEIVPLLGAGGKGRSCEVLFRMLDPQGVARGPQDIIRTAERYGLMDDIDRWVVKNTLRQFSEAPRQLAALDHCSINLSATSLHAGTLLDLVRSELTRGRIPGEKICFEITETAAVDNLAEARALMDEFRALGCRFSLDDFGSGMASYAYLRELPVDFIKIDRSFVADVDSTELNRAIVESIVNIAGLVGARTVAEGIETGLIASTVTALGVDFGQGYLYGRPRPFAGFGED